MNTKGKYNRFVFWQKNTCPHQAPWIRALADRLPAGAVTVVFQDGLPSERLALGWGQPESGPDYGGAKMFMSPGGELLDYLTDEKPDATMHIFSGAVHVPSINRALHGCLRAGAGAGLLSEGRDSRSIRGALRTAHSFFHERTYRGRIDFVLAMGRHADSWYRKCGFAPERLFPFCYSVEKPGPAFGDGRVSDRVVLTFVGQLARGKRLDLLLRALGQIDRSGWTLRILGDGAQRPALEKMAAGLGLTGNTVFVGRLDNNGVRRELAESDLLVLPSRWDGWGAVVNEALMGGVPVICSDYCGAADLVIPGFNGDVFECASLSSLAGKLAGWIAKGRLAPELRARIAEWSGCLEGPAVADYFLDIIGYLRGERSVRPRPGWLN